MACQLCGRGKAGLGKFVDLQAVRFFSAAVPNDSKPSDGNSSSSAKLPPRLTKEQQQKLRELRDRIIRVDHAGEYGANRIYAGQMAVLGTLNPISV